MTTTGGAVPAVLDAQRCLVARREPSVLRWRVEVTGRLAGAAWLVYEETRSGALAFLASGVHPSLRDLDAHAALVEHAVALHPRSHAWYVAHDFVERGVRDALRRAARARKVPLRRI